MAVLFLHALAHANFLFFPRLTPIQSFLSCSHDIGIFLLGGQELTQQEAKMRIEGELQIVKETTVLPDG